MTKDSQPYLAMPALQNPWRTFLGFWYFFSLSLILVSMPFSKFGISVGQWCLAGGWIAGWFDEDRWLKSLAGRKFGYKAIHSLPSALGLISTGIFRGFQSFYRNKAALLFFSILLLHVVGLAWTTDFGYAIKDLRIKLPLLLMPLFLSTSEPMGKKAFYRLLILFILAVLVRSFYNTWMIVTHHFIDIRDISRNISHIIFSLLLAMSIFSLGYFILKRGLLLLWQKGIALLLLGWFCTYIVLSQSFTGFAVAVIVLSALILIFVIRTKRVGLKIILSGGILIAVAGTGLILRSVVKDYYHVNPVDLRHLDKYTSQGNPYINNIYAKETDNGNLLWIYVQWEELRTTWNQRSKMPFDSLNLRSGKLAYTVLRYLNSKGWRKDADAVEKLKSSEIAAIEKGIDNCLFTEGFGFRGRIYDFLRGWDQYRETGDPTGSTLMQRLEFWKASAGIIREHWLIGIGTGDMNKAFSEQYQKMHTKLAPDQRWRSHNQFLSIWVGFGFLGLIWFLAAIFCPPLMQKRYGDYFFLVFIFIAVISMLTGDTIETQTGVTFFTLFYSLFLFARKEQDPFISPI